MLSLFLACMKPVPPVAVPSPPVVVPAPDTTAMYGAAIADAAEATPDEVWEQLTAIRQDNPALQWQVGSAEPRVRLVTWTSWTGYDDRVGAELVLAREVWVTVAPELRQRCSSWALLGEALELRLEQMLGLPPQAGKDRFVEIYARPDDLFRPCADPEVGDHRCEIEVSADHLPSVPDWHRDWYEGVKGSSYASDGYPWTRLGYTYDWGGDPASDVGLSEFVIRAGAVVAVASVEPTATFCAVSPQR